jgi:hypothetical protein
VLCIVRWCRRCNEATVRLGRVQQPQQPQKSVPAPGQLPLLLVLVPVMGMGMVQALLPQAWGLLLVAPLRLLLRAVVALLLPRHLWSPQPASNRHSAGCTQQLAESLSLVSYRILVCGLLVVQLTGARLTITKRVHAWCALVRH